MQRIKDFFSLEGPFLTFMEKLVWIFFSNIFFLLLCIPVVTMANGAKAMYAVMYNLVEDKKADLISTYFSSFKKNFVTGMAISVTTVVVMIVSVFDILYFFWMGTTMGYVLMGISIFIALFLLCFFLCMAPVMAVKEGNYKETLLNTWDFMKKNPRSVLGILISTVCFVSIAVIIMIIPAFYIFAYLLFIIVGLNAFVISYIVHAKLIGREALEEEIEE